MSATVNLPEDISGRTLFNDPILSPISFDLPVFKEDSERWGQARRCRHHPLLRRLRRGPGVPVSEEQFTGATDAVDGSAGRTIFNGLIAGDDCVVETTAPAGYSGGASATVNLPENVSGWTLLDDPIPAETYDLPVFKEDSQTGAKLGGAGFTVLRRLHRRRRTGWA